MANKIEKDVTDVVKSIVEAEGMELVEVQYRKKDDVPHITVYIYKKGGVTLNDCEAVHIAIDAPLDELNPTGETPYILNVSSPGLDRALKTDDDYRRNIGEKVEIKFFAPYDGKKMITAILNGYTETEVVVSFNEKERTIKRDKIAKMIVAIEF